MNPQYIEFNGKHPLKFEKDRKYYDEPRKGWDSSGASYSSDFLKLDIDDFDHKSGQMIEPINGKPRSNAVTAILDALNIRYNGIKTENGNMYFSVFPII